MSYVSEKIDLRQLGDDIAAELNKLRPGNGWYREPDRDGYDWDGKSHVRLKATSQAEAIIYINSAWEERKRRLSIGGEYPRHNGNSFPSRDHQPDRITLAADRGPVAIARDINRRFVAPYLSALTKGIAERNAYVTAETRRKTSATELAKACRTTPHGDGNHWTGYRNDGPYIGGEVQYDGEVKLEISRLDPATARQIIDLIYGQPD